MGGSSMEKLLNLIFWCWSFVLMIVFAFLQGVLHLYSEFLKRLPTKRFDRVRVVVVGGGFAGVAAAKVCRICAHFKKTKVN